MKRTRGAEDFGTFETPISAAQVLERCAELEADGLEFYQGLLNGAQSEWVRKLARMMVKAEIRHRDRFLRYAEHARASGKSEDASAGEPLPPELARLMSERVFVSEELAERTGHNVDERKALELAIRAEESLALLYGQIRSYVPRDQRKYLDQIIKEEQRHQSDLEKLWRKHFK
jgi:rubrerythrin